jgi:hypothetical protein
VLTDGRWNFDDSGQAADRLPRLTALFPLTDAQRRRAFDQLLTSQGKTGAEFLFGNSISETGDAP